MRTTYCTLVFMLATCCSFAVNRPNRHETCAILNYPAIKNQPPAGREIYEIKVYRFKTATQEKTLDDFLQHAYLPWLHKAGIPKVGVFKPLANDTAADKLLYVLIPFTSLEQWSRITAPLQKEPPSLPAYTNAAYNDAPYTRMESILLEAFPTAPRLQLPELKGPKEEHIYELRSYESPTEQYNVSKVKMFNAGGETTIFKRLGFNPVFYAEVLSGSHMPNLMYMTSFDNRQSRDAHWKAFGDDPDWKKLKALPEYQNNVSKADITFCHAAPYSDF